MKKKVGHNHTQVFKYLLQGGRVKIGQRTYLMCETADDQKDLAVLAHDQDGKEHYLRTHMTLGSFMILVDEMTEEEFLSVATALTIMGMNERSRWRDEASQESGDDGTD